MSESRTELWHDRKRTIFGLPLSFTKYTLYSDKLVISSGLLNTKVEEIRLYRIMDVTLNMSLGEKIWGIGTIRVCSADKSTPEFDIKRIKNPISIKELLSDSVEKERSNKQITGKEYMSSEDNNHSF